MKQLIKHRRYLALALAAGLSACVQPMPAPTKIEPDSKITGAAVPESTRQELSADLANLQEAIRIPQVSGPVAGPLSRYAEFANSSRGGAVMSSPTDRAQIVTTLYPGAIMGLSGKKRGEFIEVGYEYYGRLLTGWVDPAKVGLVRSINRNALTSEEKRALYQKILNSVNALRTKWQNNPYLKIGGFSINVDQRPSVNVEVIYK